MRASSELPTSPQRSLPRLQRRHLQEGLVLILGCVLAFHFLDRGVAVLVAAWWCLTVIIVRSDLDHLIIPDWATGGVALLALLHIVMTSGAFAHPAVIFAAVAEPFARALATFACLWSIGWLYTRFTGREGLGFGDVKLSAAIALWLATYDLIVAFELATFAALLLIVANRVLKRAKFIDGAIPFGAFIAPAAWIVYMSGSVGGAFWPWHATLG